MNELIVTGQVVDAEITGDDERIIGRFDNTTVRIRRTAPGQFWTCL
jgi:hypothetical protein